MSAPALTIYTNGNSAVSGDGLNTFQQTCDTVAQLRSFVGVTGVQVYTRGTSAVGDGGQGIFYWNATGTAADDNGVTTIVPSGSSSGEWTRIGGTGTLSATLTVTGNGTIGGTLGVTGATTLASLSASGNATIGGTLGVTGTLTGTSIKQNSLPVWDKIAIQSFTNSATYTPTPGMVYCIARLVGGGGGGAGMPATSNGSASPGAAGTYAEVMLTAAQIGASQVVTLGSAGAAGASTGGNGTSGGTTSLGSLVSCPGGGGGNYSSGSATGAVGGASGGLPTVSSGVVLLQINGQAGGNCESGTSPYLCVNGSGGSNPLGYGAPGVFLFGSGGGTIAANSPTGYGAGGGAPAVINTGSNSSGTAGTKGYLVITEFLSA